MIGQDSQAAWRNENTIEGRSSRRSSIILLPLALFFLRVIRVPATCDMAAPCVVENLREVEADSTVYGKLKSPSILHLLSET